MSTGSPQTESTADRKKQRPFRSAVLRGLAVVMPPLLTIVLFLWAWHTIESYVLVPLETGARHVAVWVNADIRDRVPEGAEKIEPSPREAGQPVERFVFEKTRYVRFKKKYLPRHVYETVESNPGEIAPTTAKAYYHRYAEVQWLPRYRVIPVFLSLFILALYFLGKFLAAGVGRILLSYFERVIDRLPIIRNVYSSVKQVTDFAFSQSEIEYTRVVAVQYPRKGVWSMGFVTGESMLDISTAANEPVLSVLMPTSPMPATGFTITVPKSETVDLNITIDQAIQFCVSCGVVVPPQQQYTMTQSGEPRPAISELIQAASQSQNGQTPVEDSPPAQPSSELDSTENRDS